MKINKCLFLIVALALCMLVTGAMAVDHSYTASTAEELVKYLNIATGVGDGVDKVNANDTVTITIPANTTIKGTFWIKQVKDIDVIIQGANAKTSVINGRFLINGQSNHENTETLTIKDLVFDGTGLNKDERTPHYG